MESYEKQRARQLAWEAQNRELYKSGSIKKNCKDCGTEFSPTSRKRQSCPPCEAKLNRDIRKNTPERHRTSKRKQYLARTQIVYNHYKNNPCEMCGEARIACLQLDHIDPSTKSFNLARAGNKSEQAVIDEIAKCRVLCANCHMIVTAEQQGWYQGLG